MADDKNKTGWQDDVKVDPNDPNEVAYLMRQTGKTREQVLKAINAVPSRSRKEILKLLGN